MDDGIMDELMISGSEPLSDINDFSKSSNVIRSFNKKSVFHFMHYQVGFSANTFFF